MGFGWFIEVFGTGTAAVIYSVRTISYKGMLVDCGLSIGEEAGEITCQMRRWIEDIQYCNIEHEWG